MLRNINISILLQEIPYIFVVNINDVWLFIIYSSETKVSIQ